MKHFDFRTTDVKPGARFMALSIDFIMTIPAFIFVLSMVDLIGNMGFYALMDFLTNALALDKDTFGNILATMIIIFFMWFWLDGATFSNRAGSIGQRFLKIMVVNNSNQCPGTAQRVLRFVFRIAYLAPIGLALFLMSNFPDSETIVSLSQALMGFFLLLMTFSVVCFFIGRPLPHEFFSRTRPSMIKSSSTEIKDSESVNGGTNEN